MIIGHYNYTVNIQARFQHYDEFQISTLNLDTMINTYSSKRRYIFTELHMTSHPEDCTLMVDSATLLLYNKH
jgi:hypothetical protein